MDLFLRACHAAVLDNDAKALAASMGLPHVSLLQRANPDNDTHRLTINHLFQILLHTRDCRPLEALADAFGFELVAKKRPAPATLPQCMIAAGKEFAELTITVHQALDDQHVSQTEKAAIRKEIGHVREVLDLFEQSVRAA
ncbi:phage regulatory CII family protein [Pseudomonas sp. RIT-PI-AD]|uniref:phage regulatory CII family protein n=1 Tax=Pseudomonas sp. RIT-PI-AD TaxID=3035294 RepID=UPI0021D947ED|nr:phage regulatory CII family protein [Pseudomonas sp. RIT-PI-AD]